MMNKNPSSGSIHVGDSSTYTCRDGYRLPDGNKTTTVTCLKDPNNPPVGQLNRHLEDCIRKLLQVSMSEVYFESVKHNV